MQKKLAKNYLCIASLMLIYALALFKTAWVTEDAYITFRTVDNFIHGFGLTWNISERVQSFTHPLWMFLLSLIYFFTHEIYYSSLVLSFILSFAAIATFSSRISLSLTASIAGIFILTFSKAFVEYSSSGLENPLSHFILALFLWTFFGTSKPNSDNFFILCLIAAFAALNRMDAILIYLPSLFYYYTSLTNKQREFFRAVTAFLPFLLWEAFSLFYYGSFFPNTAYAKLNTGIGGKALAMQGLYYFRDSLVLDPITLPVVLTGMLAPVLKKDPKNIALSAGILLYLVYIVKIGGDFMSGRFFTLPLFGSVAILSRYQFNPKKVLLFFIVIIGTGISSAQIPVLSTSEYGGDRTGIVNPHGISDERRAYYPHVGLLKSMNKDPWPDHRWAIAGMNANRTAEDLFQTNQQTDVSLFQVGTTVGLYGYFAGPRVHIIDELSLCDPLLSRLPMAKSEWRPGHFRRDIPDGYIETLVFKENRMRNASIGKFYDKLQYIICGPLFDFKRMREIWHMNTGQYDDLITSRNLESAPRFQSLKHNMSASKLLESVKTNPDDPMRYAKLYYNFGQLYRDEGEYKRAENQYILALAINPFFLKAQNALAELYALTDQVDNAISAFRRLQTMSGKNLAEIDYNLACLHSKKGRIKQAINHLKKAVEGGYHKWDKIKVEKDFDNIRSVPEYLQLLKEHGK